MRKVKYNVPRQIRVEESLLKIIETTVDKTEYSLSGFINQAIKEYLAEESKMEIDPRLELNVPFYESKDSILSFRFSKELFEQLNELSEESGIAYTKVVYQAVVYYILKLEGKQV